MILWKDAPSTLGDHENFLLTPIFIQNFNQLTYLQKLVSWLLAAGYKNICVIDNHSTYAPLLQYYNDIALNSNVHIVMRNQNGARSVLWDDRLLEHLGVTGPFVYTDSDIVPDQICPPDLVAQLARHLRNHPQILKSGPGLRIDDLPETYRFRQKVVTWEKQFWMAPVYRGVFLSLIDTTFALYRANSKFELAPALRMGRPYLARHETWYQDSDSPSAEQCYYLSEVERTSRGHWARNKLPQWLDTEVTKRTTGDLTLLHLACGKEVMAGWINLDRDRTVGADIIFDLDDCGKLEMPLAPDSIDGLFMRRAFAKVGRIEPMMQELHRVAKANARFIIRFPVRGSEDIFADRVDMRAGLLRSFVRYGQPAHAGANGDYAGDWRTRRVKLVLNGGPPASMGEAEVLDRVRQDCNVVREVIVELLAIKPVRSRDPQLLESPSLTFSATELDVESDFHVPAGAAGN